MQDAKTYNQKRRGGFIKEKLMSSFNKKGSSKVKRNVDNNNNNNNNGCVVNQELKPEPLHKTVSLVMPHHQDHEYDSSIGRIESFFGVMDDENVNMKAANYILSVRERFRLERTTSERKNQY